VEIIAEQSLLFRFHDVVSPHKISGISKQGKSSTNTWPIVDSNHHSQLSYDLDGNKARNDHWDSSRGIMSTLICAH
jgi:hypothetical protein